MMATWIHTLPCQCSSVLAGPMHMLMLPNRQQQIEFLSKEGVIVLQPESEERERFDGRTTADDHLRASSRQEIQRGEVLKDAHRVLSAQHGDRAGQTDALRACRCGSENHRRRGIEKLPAMVFTNTKRVQPYLVGVFDLLDELSQTVRRIHCSAVLVERGRETVDANLH
jgi:hypothetical protein